MADGRWRPAAAFVGILLASLAIAPAAQALPAAGALRQLDGASGCVSQTGTAGTCSQARGVNGVQGVAVSPDGKHVYTAAVASDAVGSFSRDDNGVLTQLPGATGCVSITTSEGCASGRALDVADWVVVSPDGTSVYATSAESDATAVFSRDPATGALTQLPGAAGCLSSKPTELTCAVGRGLDGAAGVVVSPDGKSAYVASFNSDAIGVFSRDVSTGELTQLAGQPGCISLAGGTCAQAGSLDGLASVELSPDGKHLYAAARWSKAVTIYSRDASTGALTRLAGSDGCVAAVASASCSQANGLPGPNSVVVSSDGAHVYVGSFVGASMAVFTRDTTTGRLMQLPGQEGCFNGDGSQPACAPAVALDGAFSLTGSPDGGNMYVAAYNSDAISVFARQASTGGLSQLSGTDACVSNSGSGGQCDVAPVLDGSHHFALAPGGEYGYAVANISDAISVFSVVRPDTVPPETTIASGPQGDTNGDAAEFSFASTEGSSTFQCRLDGPGAVTGAFEPCGSPESYAGLQDGSYTFSVRAVDAAGNVDASPATRTFRIDNDGPTTTITSGPEGPTSDASPVFLFVGEGASSFQCRLDGPDGDQGSLEGCQSPKTHTGLADGEYLLHVRAVDAAGNVDDTPATRAFTVDTVAPGTSITAGPDGDTSDTSPSFGFQASEGGSTFECRLNGPGSGSGTFEACSSPEAYAGLSDGSHSFAVRAVDAAGNVDASPATRDFRVETSGGAPRTPADPIPPGIGTPPPDIASGLPPALRLSLRPPDELLATLRRGIRLPVSCVGSCSIRVTAFVDRRTARRARLAQRGATVLVGRGASRRAAPGESVVRVRFTRDARRRLRRLRRVGMVLRTTVTYTAGGANTTNGRMTLRRYRPRLGEALRRALPAWIRCSAACHAEARLVLQGRRARRLGLGRRSIVVASGAGDLPDDRYRAVRLRFTRRARNALVRVRSARLTLWVEIRDPAGRTRATRRGIVLRR